MADDFFERLPRCQWKAKGRDAAVVIPVQRVVETVEARIAPRKRAYKNGAKMDHIGRDYLVWELEALFHNGSEEDGVPAENYPDQVNALCSSFDVNETGDLQLPTRGLVRAVFKGYRRVEQNDVRVAAAVNLTFWEDTEDGLSQASFVQGSGRATVRSTVTLVQAACAARGVWSEDIVGLEGLATDLESFASAPLDVVESVAAQATAAAHLIGRVETAFTGAANTANAELGLLLSEPEASFAARNLREMADVAQRVVANTTGVGLTTIVKYARDVSIFDVATKLGQDATKLSAMNRSLPNLLRISAGTPIRVFAA